MKLLLLAIFSASVLVPSASAEPAKARTCRLVFPERPHDAPKTAFLYDGEKSREIALPSMNFSEVIALPAGKLVIALTPTAIAAANDVPSGSPQLKIAGDVNDFYILISPDPSNATLPLGLKMVAASDGGLKPGETIWFNLTDHRISLEMGESKMTVDSQSQTVSKAPLPESGYFKAAFSYQKNSEGDLQKMTEQSWWHDAKSRHMGIIMNSGGMLPKVSFYRDFR